MSREKGETETGEGEEKFGKTCREKPERRKERKKTIPTASSDNVVPLASLFLVTPNFPAGSGLGSCLLPFPCLLLLFSVNFCLHFAPSHATLGKSQRSARPHPM